MVSCYGLQNDIATQGGRGSFQGTRQDSSHGTKLRCLQNVAETWQQNDDLFEVGRIVQRICSGGLAVCGKSHRIAHDRREHSVDCHSSTSRQGDHLRA